MNAKKQLRGLKEAMKKAYQRGDIDAVNTISDNIEDIEAAVRHGLLEEK